MSIPEIVNWRQVYNTSYATPHASGDVIAISKNALLRHISEDKYITSSKDKGLFEPTGDRSIIIFYQTKNKDRLVPVHREYDTFTPRRHDF